jgi:hypothetical protein
MEKAMKKLIVLLFAVVFSLSVFANQRVVVLEEFTSGT